MRMGSLGQSNSEVLARKTYFKTIISVVYLEGKESTVSVGTLQKFLEHSESAMTYQLSELESLGIVERSRDPKDKRRMHIRIKPEGLTRAYVEHYLVERANRLIDDLEVWNSPYLAGLNTEVRRLSNLNTPSVRKQLYGNEYFLELMNRYLKTYAHLTFEIAHAKRKERVDISIQDFFDHISAYMGNLWIPESEEELQACSDDFRTVVEAWRGLNDTIKDDDALQTFWKLVRYGSIVNVSMSDVSIAGLVVAELVRELEK